MVERSVKSLSMIASATILSLSLMGCGGGSTTNTEITVIPEPAPVTDWELVWSDEFDGDAINFNNWTHEVNCQGGGNNEKQCYTDDPSNSFVSDGMLNIVALPAEDGAPLPYTSARLNTQFKQDFTYGRFEMRAKLPFGQGTWPAFWMLFTDGVYGDTWPTSGEIDIMEAVNLGEPKPDGGIQTDVFGTLYYGNLFPNQSSSGKAYTPPNGINPADDFHTYAIEWQEGEIRWYMDDYLYATQRQSELRLNSQGNPIGLRHRGWFVPGFDPVTGEEINFYNAAPFDEDFYIILNLAVGGNFPENFNRGGIDPTVFENGQTFQIDYVRVFECSVDPRTGKGCETVRPGYDDLEDALVEGDAPSPTPPPPTVTNPITIFADTLAQGWTFFDCCGGTEPAIVMADEAEFGAVAQFEILNNEGTVLGFNSRLEGEPYNAGGLLTNGSLMFDMKVLTPPSADTVWLIKVEADNNTTFAEVPLNTSTEGRDPVTGEWQRYTFPLQDLADAGLDLGNIDIVLIFPAWQTGEGAVYQVDNLRIGADDAPSFPELVLFEDGANPDFPLWDCCGGTTPAEVMDDEEHGTVAEFEILNNDGTVLGFNGRDSGNLFDASALLNEGVLQFEMRVVSPPQDTTWLLKVEAGSPNENFAEVALETSLEGVPPGTGEWQTYTFPLLALADAGLDISAIDVIMVFPAWQTGAGAVYRIDNAKIFNPNAQQGGGPSGPLLEVFANGANEMYPAWDCCGGTTPTVEMDDAEHGAVTQFEILNNDGTVLGFNGRDLGNAFDATDILTTGVLQFEMRVVSPPQDTTWLMKIESGDGSIFAELPLEASMEGATPVTGEWQTYTYPLLTLSDAGLDVSNIDVILVFPAWQTGAGAVYRIDNMYIGNPSDISSAMGGAGGGSGGGNDDAALTIFSDMVNTSWAPWDCCGGTTPTVEMDDAAYGAVVEFSIPGNPETVQGFNSVVSGGEKFNAESILSNGVFQFDMKIVASPGADTQWLMKIEADGNTSFAELNLADSIEGQAPVPGQWQTYTYDLLTLLDAGLDVSAIDVVLMFPAWGTGAGAIYRVDNVVFKEQ